MVLRGYPGPQIVVRLAGAGALDHSRGSVAEGIIAAIQDIGILGVAPLASGPETTHAG